MSSGGGRASSARRAPAAPLAAYVLHQYDWSETSLIVELYTRERGRLVAAARGAKRPYSQLRGVLLPFQPLLVAFGRRADEAQAELLTLRSAEWAGGVAMPAGAALLPGLYLNELLLRLLARQDPHPALYDAYAGTVAALAGADEAGRQAALRAFELRLLRETGVLPELLCVTSTQAPVQAGSAYTLHPEAGVQPAGGTGIDGATLEALQAALDAGAAAQPALAAACALAGPALRAGLRALLDYHLAAPLRTRRLLADLHRLLDPPRP